MKPLKIALIVLAALILTPILLMQGLSTYLSLQNAATDAQTRPAVVSSARDCVSLKENRPSAWDIGDEKYGQFLKGWIETCEREVATEPSPAVRLSL